MLRVLSRQQPSSNNLSVAVRKKEYNERRRIRAARSTKMMLLHLVLMCNVWKDSTCFETLSSRRPRQRYSHREALPALAITRHRHFPFLVSRNPFVSSDKLLLKQHPPSTSLTRLHDSESSTEMNLSAISSSISSTSTAVQTASPADNNNNNPGRNDEGIVLNSFPFIKNVTELSDIAEDCPRLTAAGGYTHTSASKAKISAANKGKVPWNKGKGRSDEVRARISAGVRAKNRERFLQKLKDLGMTEEEYEAKKLEDRRKKDAERRARRTEKGGYRPTEETKKKISRILKEKHARGEIKKKSTDPSKVRRGFTHSAETRAKISESLRKRWANDPNYRAHQLSKAKTGNTNKDVRRRISESLRKKWQDPEFRAEMMAKIANRKSTTGVRRDLEHRQKISEAMKLKWQDESYRTKTLASIAARKGPVRKSKAPTTPNKAKSTRKPNSATIAAKRPKASVEQVLRRSSSSSFSLGSPNSLLNDDNDAAEAAPRISEPMAEPRKAKPKTTRRRRTKTVAKNNDTILPVAAKPKTIKKVTVTDGGNEGKDKRTPAPKKRAKRKKANGSRSLMKEERRDLYDLLYGDEDAGAADIDENFDPYDLEPSNR